MWIDSVHITCRGQIHNDALTGEGIFECTGRLLLKLLVRKELIKVSLTGCVHAGRYVLCIRADMDRLTLVIEGNRRVTLSNRFSSAQILEPDETKNTAEISGTARIRI